MAFLVAVASQVEKKTVLAFAAAALKVDCPLGAVAGTSVDQAWAACQEVEQEQNSVDQA